MNYKKFGILFIIAFILSVTSISLIVIIIDPYFHYHKPLKNLNYELDIEYQRYQNDGIVKHFDYDSIITGSSMTENFKTSEFDDLFNANSIKVSFSGATFRETYDLLSAAFSYNNNIKYVVMGLDYSNFYNDKDYYKYNFDYYPKYLYDDHIFNDINYLLNKKIFFISLSTLNNKKSTTFDEYSYWADNVEYGKEILDNSYNRPNKSDIIYDVTEKDKKTLEDNVNQNIINFIKKHKDTEFYLFYPPYSIYAWDYFNQLGYLIKDIKGEKIITEMLLKYDNVHIFSFLDMYDYITNLNNYMDKYHYNGNMNHMILQFMKSGNHELTEDNYELYYKKIIEYYNNFDYDKMFN